jgi:nucleotide-binding universal stress UspA family protein
MTEPVLCPIDFTSHCDQVVERAITRALDLDAPVVLLHVMFTPSDTDYDAAEGEGSPRTTMWKGLLEKAEAQMARHATRVEEAGVQVQTAFVDGIASVAIREAADTHKAQLIVMGGRERGALAKFFLGSVSDNVRDDGDTAVEIVAG